MDVSKVVSPALMAKYAGSARAKQDLNPIEKARDDMEKIMKEKFNVERRDSSVIYSF